MQLCQSKWKENKGFCYSRHRSGHQYLWNESSQNNEKKSKLEIETESQHNSSSKQDWDQSQRDNKITTSVWRYSYLRRCHCQGPNISPSECAFLLTPQLTHQSHRSAISSALAARRGVRSFCELQLTFKIYTLFMFDVEFIPINYS